MKKVSVTLIFILSIVFYRIGEAQEFKAGQLFVQVNGSDGIPSISIDSVDTIIVMKNLSLQKIFQDNHVYSFIRAFPVIDSFKIHNKYGLDKVYKLLCQCNQENLMNQIKADSGGFYKYVEQIPVGHSQYTPNDYDLQDNIPVSGPDSALNLISAKEAWDITRGDPNIKIGIFEKNLTSPWTHQDIQGQIVYWDTIGTEKTNFHALFVCGCAAGATDNGVGKSSIGFNCKIMFSGNYLDYGDMLKFSYLGAKVLNTSYATNGPPSNIDQNVINAITDNGSLLVASAGNDTVTPFYPSLYANVLSVTSVGFNDHHISWDNPPQVDANNDSVDICAPGYHVMGLWDSCNTCYKRSSGTSFAAPIVAGAAALIYSINPCLDPSDVTYILKSTADDIYQIPENHKFIGRLGAGRLNAYKAVHLADSLYHPKNYDIRTGLDTTWNSVVYVTDTVKIDSGGKLTIKNKVIFSENARLIVKPGGVLVVDGGQLKSCPNHSWRGIEVWGNYSQSQYPTINGARYQGLVVLKDSAKISDAYDAVRLWKPGDYSTSGGILQASNAIFKNNKRAVEFIAYHNTNPINHDTVSNFSYFTGCRFITDDYYVIADPFFGFITMWKVEGINISGCSFYNLKSYNSSIERGYGIETIDANFRVQPLCTSPYYPCPSNSLDSCKFRGLFAGIDAQIEETVNTVYINCAAFYDNSYGVKFEGVNYGTIVKSYFQIGSNTLCPNFTGIGIELDNCNGYMIEENTMTTISWPVGASFLGIRVVSPQYVSNVLYNNIYKNQLVGLSIGNQAEGQNFNPNNYTGLCYYCNYNEMNNYDFYVTDQGVRLNQGASDTAAGNVFSQNPTYDFYNNGSWGYISYYYNNQNPPEKPNHAYRLDLYSANPNPCPSHLSGGSNPTPKLTMDQISAYEQDFANNNSIFNNVNALYQSLKDGGSTEGTELDIQNSTSSQTIELRDELLGKSPHLSEDVLKAAADRYDVLPDSILFEILSANPDELRNEELLTYLKEMPNPLPDYMIDLLREIACDTTYKTTLLRQMGSANGYSTQDAYIIIRDILNDSIVNLSNLRNWLDNLQDISADYQIIDSWLQQGNTTSAISLVNMLPELYNMDDSALNEYNQYKTIKTMQAQLINEGKNLFQYDSVQIAELYNIANNSKGQAGTIAKNILEFGYGVFFIDCAPLPMGPTKSVKIINPKIITKGNELKITVFPNPANELITFKYSIPDQEQSSYIQIDDLKGQLIDIIILKNLQGEVVWDTWKVPTGVYVYTLKSEKYSKSGRITVRH